MKIFDTVLYKKGNEINVGIKEQFSVRKRKKGILTNITVCLSPSLQPLVAYTTKEKVAVEITEERMKKEGLFSVFYPTKNVGYIMEIKYTQTEEGTEKFNYVLYTPTGFENNKIKGVRILNIKLKDNLISYYKQLCQERYKYKYRGKVSIGMKK